MPSKFNKTSRAFAIGRIAQTAYATPTAPGTFAPLSFVQQIITDDSMPKVTKKTVTNAGHSTGNRFPTERWTTEWDSMFAYQFLVSAQNIGLYLLAAFGKVTTTAVAGSAGAYQHVFEPLNFATGLQLPAYSILDQLNPTGNGTNSLLPSMNLESLDLSAAGTDRISASASWHGSGEEIKPSGVNWATNVTKTQGTQNYFTGTQGKVSTTAPDGAKADDLACNFLSWKLGVKNTLASAAGYLPGCPRFKDATNKKKGVIRSEHLLDDQQFDTMFTAYMRENSPEHSAFNNEDPLILNYGLIGDQIGATASNFSLNFKHFLAYYDAVDRATSGNMVTVDVKPSLLYDQSANGILTATLINDVASYVA